MSVERDYEFEKIMREKATCDMVDDFMQHALKQKELDVSAFLDVLLDAVCRTYVHRIDDSDAAEKYIHEHVSEYFKWGEVFREARAEEELFEKHFGVCPHCHTNDGFFNVEAGHWFVCHDHKVKWCVDPKLVESWKGEIGEEQKGIFDIRNYQNVVPYHDNSEK